jgi:hypothetical protein
VTGDFQRRYTARRTLAQDAALAETVGALGDRGVRVLVIKGAATARLLQLDRAGRPSADLDLLVDEPAFDTACETLAALGFRRKLEGARASEFARQRHAHTWIRGTPVAMSVDLHFSLWGLAASPGLFATLCRDAQPVQFGQVAVEIPGDAACAMIVAVHATQVGERREKQLDDLTRAIALVPDEIWQGAARLARELGALEQLGAGLALVPAGAALAVHLGLPCGRPAARRPGSGDGVATLWIQRLRQSAGPLDAARVARDALAPSAAYVRARHPELGTSSFTLAGYYVRRWARAPGQLVRHVRGRLDRTQG